MKKAFLECQMSIIFAALNGGGAIAQLVEQRTENPCVPGSIPGGTTKKAGHVLIGFFLLYALLKVLKTLMSEP